MSGYMRVGRETYSYEILGIGDRRLLLNPCDDLALLLRSQLLEGFHIE